MKKIFVSWHYTTHGVAYLKHILSRFYLERGLPDQLKFEGLDQEELSKAFNLEVEDGFIFDEVIYLIAPQTAFDEISSRRFSHRNTILEDPMVNMVGLELVMKAVFEEFREHNLKEEIRFVELQFPNQLEAYQNLLWRFIQHYSIEDQLEWLLNRSNYQKVYKKFTIIKFDLESLRKEASIALAVRSYFEEYQIQNEGTEFIINVALGSNETQVVWHILAQAGVLPTNSRFLKTYDDKRDRLEERFKKFSIEEVPVNLFSRISSEFSLFYTADSPQRKVVNKKMEAYLNSGFSILLLGERGIGKSQIARKAASGNEKIIEANCASFDDDSKAEAELFGYMGGSFSGALREGKAGLLEVANGGILFLDEVHHLSKMVQAKLMKAIQTDEKNKMSIRRLGSTSEKQVECRLIFATNKTIKELHEVLLPDFYDRIVQHVISIPPLRETKEDLRSDWQSVWAYLKFESKLPDEPELFQWLKVQPLFGNYRDLQKIAMYYNAFHLLDMETKNNLGIRMPFQFAKSEFEKYHSASSSNLNSTSPFDPHKTPKEMIAEFQYNLQDWAVTFFKGRKAAIDHFRFLGDTITERTFNDWKNKGS